VFSLQGFLILDSIIGGQALGAVSDKVDDTLGIVIIALISFVVRFQDLFKKTTCRQCPLLFVFF
jgi:purine-cytosine permease-like protein